MNPNENIATGEDSPVDEPRRGITGEEVEASRPRRALEEPQEGPPGNPETTGEEPQGWPVRRLLVALLAVLVIVPLLALATVKFIIPMVQNQQAAHELSTLGQGHGDIAPANTTLQTFRGQTLKSANVDQKALVRGSDGAQSGVVIFTNGKAAGHRRIVDVYMDFDSPKSRDFILLNQSMLRNMVENGLIELKIHPVPSGSAISAYSSEALAESIVTTPTQTWELLLALLRNGANVNTDKADEVMASVLGAVKDSHVNGVDATSIGNGTFASWMLAVGDDGALRSGYSSPTVLLNGQVLPDQVNLNNSRTLQDHILNH